MTDRHDAKSSSEQRYLKYLLKFTFEWGELRPILLYISDINDGMKRKIVKFTDGTKC